jgi:hypothetical protein
MRTAPRLLSDRIDLAKPDPPLDPDAPVSGFHSFAMIL